MPKNRFKFPCARRFRWNRISTYYPKLSHFILLFARQIVKTCTMMEYRLVSYRITNPIRRFPRDRLPIPSYDFYGGSFEKKLNGNGSRKCLWGTLGEEKSDQRWFPLFVRFRSVALIKKPPSGALFFQATKVSSFQWLSSAILFFVIDRYGPNLSPAFY